VDGLPEAGSKLGLVAATLLQIERRRMATQTAPLKPKDGLNGPPTQISEKAISKKLVSVLSLPVFLSECRFLARRLEELK
jgi:hypothetical protein